MTDVRVTQVPVEVIRDGTPDARITQMPVEVIRDGIADVRATQFAVEVIRSVDSVTREIIVSDTLSVALIENGSKTIVGAPTRPRPHFWIPDD